MINVSVVAYKMDDHCLSSDEDGGRMLVWDHCWRLLTHHHMWRFMFKFHLVPLVLVELFVCRKYSKKRPKWWQTLTFGPSGRDTRLRAQRQEPPGLTCGPATSLICGISSSANGKPPSKSVWSRDKICSRWIHGPIVIHLELSTDLTIDFLSKFHHVLSSQAP
jgi:hypothetical protein